MTLFLFFILFFVGSEGVSQAQDDRNGKKKGAAKVKNSRNKLEERNGTLP